jgi:hypothetical protein
MVYVGINHYRNRSQLAVLDSEGSELLSRRIVSDRATFLELLAGLGDAAEIGVEATYGCEERLAELLEEDSKVPDQVIRRRRWWSRRSDRLAKPRRAELRHNRLERPDQFEARDVVGVGLDVDEQLGEPGGILALM